MPIGQYDRTKSNWYPWNKGKKQWEGKIHPCTNKPCSEETKRKIGEANSKKVHTNPNCMCASCKSKRNKKPTQPKVEKKLPRRGINHPCWKGGKVIISGYIHIHQPEHPFAKKQGYILEHHLIMEKEIKRYITKEERVHHINGNKLDNRIENLMFFPNESEHQKLHHRQRLEL